eukprot:16442901-Heterocapsa_arctica.AAC.1
MAGAGLLDAYTLDLSGPRLGRTQDGGDPTVETRAATIDEMSHELLNKGSLYDWFARQFWRLRYAGTHMLVRHRIIQQLDYVQKCIVADQVPKPKLRATQGATRL